LEVVPQAAKASVEADPRPAHYAKLVREVAARHSEADPNSFRTVFSLISTYDTFFSHFSRRMARYSLTIPGFNVLMILAHGENREAGYPMHAIGELLLASRANITGLVDSLEKKGLVRRREDPDDRRSKLVRITPAGDRLLKKILPGHLRAVHRVAGVFNETEIDRLCGLLAKFRAGVDAARSSANDD
jgi:MarR family 2-MHQ and catechol resistance regulon transcriptional repressor